MIFHGQQFSTVEPLLAKLGKSRACPVPNNFPRQNPHIKDPLIFVTWEGQSLNRSNWGGGIRSLLNEVIVTS